MAWLARTDHGVLRPPLQAAARAGDVLAPFVAASAWILATDRTSGGRAAVARGWAAVGVTAVVEGAILKPLVGRSRPEAERLPRGQRRAKSPSTSAFPSGHIGVAAAFSVTVGFAVPRWRWALAASAAVIAYSRLYTGRHFLSDAVVGTALGCVAGGYCTRLPFGAERAIPELVPPVAGVAGHST